MALWKINDIDITEEFGVVLKRGAYNAIFQLPAAKGYLTESTREQDGESVVFFNPKSEARDITIPIYIGASDLTDFWDKYNRFTAFIKNNPIELSLEAHNRVYRLYYKSCNAYTHRTKFLDRQIYVECSLVVREPNPAGVLERTFLSQEIGDYLLTEDNEEIEILSRI